MTDNTKKLFNADCNVIDLDTLNKGRSKSVKALKASIKAAHEVFTSKDSETVERNKATSILAMFIVMTDNLVTMIDQNVADQVGCKREYIVGVRSLAKNIIADDGTKVKDTEPFGTADAVGISDLKGVLEGFESGLFSVWKNRNTYKKVKGTSTPNPQKSLAKALKSHSGINDGDVEDVAKMLCEGTNPMELFSMAASKLEKNNDIAVTISDVLGTLVANLKIDDKEVTTETLNTLKATCTVAIDTIDEVLAGRAAKEADETDDLGVDLSSVSVMEETSAVEAIVN